MPRGERIGESGGMNLKTFLLVPAAALALAAAGCGDDDKSTDTGASSNPPAQQQSTESQSTPAPAPASDAPAGGEDAIKQVVLDYTFEGDCDTMTDKFLETQAFTGDTRKERCDYFEKTFQTPQYKESDVKFRKVSVNGDKATVVIGSDIANIETEYSLVAEGGQWKLDEFDLQ
jgi:hypothetical protein